MIKEIRWEVNSNIDIQYTTGMSTATITIKGYDGETATLDLDGKELAELKTTIQDVLILFPVDP